MDPLLLMLGVLVLFFVMNALIARPQQKKLAEQQRRVAEMPAGTRVMTTSGIYGTAVHIGEKQVVLEISPGVEMTVSKAAIREIVDAADDEFEYADDDALDAAGAAPALGSYETYPGAPATGSTLDAPSASAADADAVDTTFPAGAPRDDTAEYRPETLEESQRRLSRAAEVDGTDRPADDDGTGSSRVH